MLFKRSNYEGDGAYADCSSGMCIGWVPADPHYVLYVGRKQGQLLDYLSSIMETPALCVAAMQDSQYLLTQGQEARISLGKLLARNLTG